MADTRHAAPATTTGVVRIGVTGHSDLTPASGPLVSASLHRWLAPRDDQPPWVGVSCLVAGADQLFAALVLGLGGDLEVILPAADYRAHKVTADNIVEFDRLRAAATKVTVLTAAPSWRAAYIAANHALLARVGMVVAVWDGQPARRPGSTADVVAAARRLGLPVEVLWPAGAARQPPSVAPGRRRR